VNPIPANRTERLNALRALLKERIVVLDGAMGTMIQAANLTEADVRGARFADHHIDVGGNLDLLSLTQPELVGHIHRAYLEAGADILTTNTFSATTISQADFALESLAHDMNIAATQIARSVADAVAAETGQPRFVAGVLGPTNRTASISPDIAEPARRDISFDHLETAYAEALDGLVAGGADVILIETIFDTLNAKAAIHAVLAYRQREQIDLPVMISGTITDRSGRTLTGQTVEAFWNSVRHADPISVGLNCALGMDELRQHVVELSRVADAPVSCYPNAGLPNELGECDETPPDMATSIGALAADD